MEVFTGSADHTNNTEPETVKLNLEDKSSPSAHDILKEILNDSELLYTVLAAAEKT